MKDKNGIVYIVGAGPGDPELITVKGLNILRSADCVLYDFLSSPELLKYTPGTCEKICVGKKDGFHLKEQDQTNKLLYEKSKIHNKVVRLKGGDPFVFSRGVEEARFLKSKGIKYQVVPGITSAFAAPLSFGVPLTIKGKVTSVAVVAGRKADINAEIEAPKCGTLIYLMAVANIKNVVKALKKNKYPLDTPCAFIEKATHKKTRMIRATIESIEQKVMQEKVKPPAVLVVGEVLDYD